MFDDRGAAVVRDPAAAVAAYVPHDLAVDDHQAQAGQRASRCRPAAPAAAVSAVAVSAVAAPAPSGRNGGPAAAGGMPVLAVEDAAAVSACGVGVDGAPDDLDRPGQVPEAPVLDPGTAVEERVVDAYLAADDGQRAPGVGEATARGGGVVGHHRRGDGKVPGVQDSATVTGLAGVAAGEHHPPKRHHRAGPHDGKPEVTRAGHDRGEAPGPGDRDRVRHEIQAAQRQAVLAGLKQDGGGCPGRLGAGFLDRGAKGTDADAVGAAAVTGVSVVTVIEAVDLERHGRGGAVVRRCGGGSRAQRDREHDH